jgi:LmbE family N-acetylglucosaminyl deacetylase
MAFSGPVKMFQSIRYKLIARGLARLNRAYRFTGSPEFRPIVTNALEKSVVLSISPHPDDDVLAIGGTLAGHIAAGGEVHSIIWTDGVRGTEKAEKNDDILPLRRQEECRCAAKILGITSVNFQNEPDGKLRLDKKNTDLLRHTIQKIHPQYIYTPFPVDYHFDHIAATEIVVKTLQRMPNPPLVRGYESIIPLIPNKIIDITGFVELKRRAVKCFESQNAVSDYSRTIVEGLNRHRSYGEMRGKGYGEAVFESEWSLFEQILQIVHGCG